MSKRKNTPKIQVFCLPQFKDPYVIIELKGKIYRGFYSKPKIYFNPKFCPRLGKCRKVRADEF